MSLSARQSTTSYASNKPVTTASKKEVTTACPIGTDVSATEAVVPKKSNFPKTFTTPQNCFENLTSGSGAIAPAGDSWSANTPSADKLEVNTTDKESAKCIIGGLPMKNNALEDCAEEITTIQQNSTPKVSVESETPDSAQFTKCGYVKNLHVDQVSLLDTSIVQNNTSSIAAEHAEFHLEGEYLANSEERTTINLISSDDIHVEEDSLSKASENSLELIRGNSAPDTPLLRNTSRLSERAKKKSWYNVLYPNYKSRSQDFKKLFKEIPNDERLIVDYSCALYRDLLIQGRLYISQNYVGFHANILGWETCISIKWKDVTSITKEKTALVIPNAISVSTPKENYFFSSFTTRDKTFLILFRVWQNSLMNKSLRAHEVWQLVHNYYGEELGLTTDDEDYIDPSNVDPDRSSISEFVSALDDSVGVSNLSGSAESSNLQIKKIIFNIASSSSSGSGSSTGSGDGFRHKDKIMKSNAKELTLISAKPDEGNASSAQMSTSPATSKKDTSADRNSSGNTSRENKVASTAHDVKRKVAKSSRNREESTSKKVENLPTDVSDSSDSEGTNIPFVATAECTSPHEGRQLVHTILPINIETLLNLLFSKSKFLLDFHAMRKSTELTFGEWITSEEGQKTRTVNVTVQLAASVGPKTSKVTEHQVMRDCSKPGELYSIDVNSVNAGIPYADSFSVLIHYCLVKTVDDHTMLSVHGQIKYKKSIWGVVKGFIEKNTWAGLEDFYGSLLQSLQSETCIPPAKGKGRRPRRGTAVQIRSLEEAPPLLSKPEPMEHLIGAQTFASRSSAESPIMVAETTNKYRWLSLFVLVLLCFLIIVNVILLLKLWRLEDRLEEDLSNRARVPNFSALKQLPSNHEDWIELLRQQEILHETELRKWHTVLQTAIELLKKTEKTLAELMFR